MRYEPKDDVSKQMLLSIPNKVYMWLMQINPKEDDLHILEDGSLRFTDLHWQFSGEDQFVEIGDTRISWQGSMDNPTDLTGSEQWMENLTDSLVEFIALEFAFYDCMELFAVLVFNRERSDAEDRDIQASSTPEV